MIQDMTPAKELGQKNGNGRVADKFVYLFSEVDQAETKVGNWDKVRGLLGGKGANLGDMTRLGVPVPPGFTISTEACNAYLEAGEKFPEGMWEEVLDAV
jgi:pyruvate,orthophosphate dikinase